MMYNKTESLNNTSKSQTAQQNTEQIKQRR